MSLVPQLFWGCTRLFFIPIICVPFLYSFNFCCYIPHIVSVKNACLSCKIQNVAIWRQLGVNEWMVFGLEPFLARCTKALRQTICAPYSILSYSSPVLLPKLQMAPIFSFLISSGSKKKEHRHVCLSEAKASHSHKMWAVVPPQYHISYRSGYYSAPLYIDVFSTFMSSKQANNNPGLSLIKGQ